MKQWYIVKSKPAKESQAVHILQQGNFEVFYPRLRELVYRKQGPDLVIKPLFSSYFFIRSDLSENRNFHLVKYTRGVSHVLCAGGVPLPVRPEIIAAIRARSNLEGVVEIPREFRAGQIVRVKRGILKELIGVLETPSADGERVRVLLKLINYRMRASFHVSELEIVKGV